MGVKCFCCEKYLGESNLEYNIFFCDDCADIIKEKFGNNVSMLDLMELRK